MLVSLYIPNIFGAFQIAFLKQKPLTLLSTGMHRRLDQIHSSINDQSYEITTLQTRSAHLEEDLQVRVQTQSSLTAQQNESLKSLKQELHNRLQQGEELDVRLAELQREMEMAEERVKV